MGILFARTGGKWVPVAQGSADQRWFSAWGIVATGTFAFGDGAPFTSPMSLTNPLVVQTVAGRRYRVRMVIRAVSSATTQAIYCMLQSDGGNVADRYSQIISVAYNKIDGDWMFTGDGASHSYVVMFTAAGGYQCTGYSSGGNYYIEDLGPVTGASLIPQVAITAWTAPTLTNGWQNAPGWQPMQYRMYGDMVQLRGHIYAGTVNSNAFQLPVGYRPPALIQVPTGVATGQATISTDGTVQSNVSAHISVVTQFSVST